MIKINLLVISFGLTVLANAPRGYVPGGFPVVYPPCYEPYTGIVTKLECGKTEVATEKVAEKAPVEPVVAVNTETLPVKKVYFKVNEALPSKEAKAELDELISWMGKNAYSKIVIEGYADHTGKADHNQKLSEKRAENVKGYLKNKGVKADVSVTAYGDKSENERKAVVTIVK